jgi:hypothetical protein
MMMKIKINKNKMINHLMKITKLLRINKKVKKLKSQNNNQMIVNKMTIKMTMTNIIPLKKLLIEERIKVDMNISSNGLVIIAKLILGNLKII